MVYEISKNDINDVNEIGSLLNPNFARLFHIDNLNENEKIFVYKEDGKILGFIHYGVNYEIADLLNIVVLEKYRNKGIGSILIDYMITELPVSVLKILLEVNESNQSAIGLYRRFGFKLISERKNYYKGNKALIMERVLR